jgi:hypothetical protein
MAAAAALLLALLGLTLAPSTGPARAQDKAKPINTKDDTSKKDASKKDAPPKQPPIKLGLHTNGPKAFQGYTLLAPLESAKTYLLDMQGRVVRTWESDCAPALCPMLLANGHLLRPGSIGGDSRVFGPGPGVGGRIQEFTWEGELVWDFKFYNARQLPHHDMTRLPNGNVMLIVSDRKTAEEALAAGRRPEMTGDSHLIPDSVVEIKPTGKTTGQVVWEWHLWDHLIQDFDKTKANYGKVAEHPELVNINYGEDELTPNPTPKDGPDKSKSKAGANPTPSRQTRVNPDWTHFNGVAYNAELDQLAVSVHAFSEFWIIDHSTTTAEAAGHTGGKSGKGGDLLYRWGNPRAYRAGTKADQKLFSQHNAHWIPRGHPGEGHLLVFNNGGGRPDGTYSSVDELVLPADSEGRYLCKPGKAYGPDKPVWSYSAPTKSDFYSSFISGAQRLPNGNTLICSGANGTVFEVTPEKEIVWKYVNPVKGSGMGFGAPAPPGQILSPITRDLLAVSAEQHKQLDEIQKQADTRLGKLLTTDQRKQIAEQPRGPGPGGPPSQPGQVMARSEQDRLKLTDQQKKELAALQKDVDDRMDKVLQEAQKKQLKKSFAPFGGGPPQRVPIGTAARTGSSQPGKILSPPQQETLKLSPEQKKKLEEIQKEVDAKLDKLLTDDQKSQLRAMQQGPGGGGPGGPGGGPGRGGPPGGTPLFRAYRYAANYPGFSGKDLKPGKTLEESPPKEPEKKVAQKKN